MKVLILGSGGREHALGWSIHKNPQCESLYFAPGNGGTVNIGVNLPVQPDNFEAVREAILEHGINLVIVGPEAPLVKGIRNFLEKDPHLREVLVLGPSSEGAMLEGSKDYAKAFMKRHNIPTAGYATFNDTQKEEAAEYIRLQKPPIVLKADGLAAGKGVVICDSPEDAIAQLDAYFVTGKFGDAGKKVVIEEFMEGIEMSVFAICDGRNYVLLPNAKDYKRAGEGDTGPNTGGMGCISPVPFADGNFLRKVEDDIIKPTINGLRKEGIDYRGFLYFGLMKTGDRVRVVEYNVRLGDPETEVILPRVSSDLLKVFAGAASGNLADLGVDFTNDHGATIILVSGGYPGAYEKGKEITGVDDIDGSIVFHAGTRIEEGTLVTNGGRVLALTSLGKSLEEAINRSYESARSIKFDKMSFRKDIGKDVI